MKKNYTFVLLVLYVVLLILGAGKLVQINVAPAGLEQSQFDTYYQKAEEMNTLSPNLYESFRGYMKIEEQIDPYNIVTNYVNIPTLSGIFVLEIFFIGLAICLLLTFIFEKRKTLMVYSFIFTLVTFILYSLMVVGRENADPNLYYYLTGSSLISLIIYVVMLLLEVLSIYSSLKEKELPFSKPFASIQKERVLNEDNIIFEENQSNTFDAQPSNKVEVKIQKIKIEKEQDDFIDSNDLNDTPIILESSDELRTEEEQKPSEEVIHIVLNSFEEADIKDNLFTFNQIQIPLNEITKHDSIGNEVNFEYQNKKYNVEFSLMYDACLFDEKINEVNKKVE